MRTLAVLICLVVTLALPACADMYTFSIPGVTGNYQDSSAGPASMTAAFDFSQSFAQIDMVDISLSGYMRSGQSQSQIHDPYPSTRLLGGTFFITISDANGVPGMNASRDFQVGQQSSLYFNDMLMTGGMPGTLLSGRGFITVNFSTETDIYTTQYSSPDIYDLSIIVTGNPAAPTPVPEPSTMAAGIACLAPFLLRRRK